jgi:hypothetical protein
MITYNELGLSLVWKICERASKDGINFTTDEQAELAEIAVLDKKLTELHLKATGDPDNFCDKAFDAYLKECDETKLRERELQGNQGMLVWLKGGKYKFKVQGYVGHEGYEGAAIGVVIE